MKRGRKADSTWHWKMNGGFINTYKFVCTKKKNLFVRVKQNDIFVSNVPDEEDYRCTNFVNEINYSRSVACK